MKYTDKQKANVGVGRLGSMKSSPKQKYGFDIDPEELPFNDKMALFVPVGYKPPYIQVERYLILESSINFD